MNLRTLALILAAGYLVYSIHFVLTVGFEDPRRAIWVGLIGLAVMAVAMMLRALGRRK